MFPANPEHLFLLQKRKEGRANCRFSASERDCCTAGWWNTRKGQKKRKRKRRLTSPKAPRPITFRISKSSLCSRICFTLEVKGLAAGRRMRDQLEPVKEAKTIIRPSVRKSIGGDQPGRLRPASTDGSHPLLEVSISLHLHLCSMETPDTHTLNDRKQHAKANDN